ncbi:ABC transporter substrate-binding protein [Pygmaiobacter massiliensis]|uniref:ABC transporter substrate-binding protein n=1 Tax=Pygmaiobacter massiliensis TaxID=1917873 RepID=UPI000C7D148C|nr:ABC transporter substrate-binding protein [Pygmaiobacter massiliensis]
MKKIFAALLAGALAISLVACGTSSSTASVASAGDSSKVTSAPASETPTLDAIKQKGKIVMLTSTGFPPYEYLGDDGKPAGVDIDLAQLVADDLGVELEVIDMNFDLLIDALKSGKGDFIAAGMTANEERATHIDFSQSYTANGLLMVVAAGNDTIKTAADLAGKTIAVQSGTTADLYANDEVKGAKVLTFKTPIEAGTAVAGGKADVAIIDNLPAKSIAESSNGKLQVIEGFITEEPMAMGIAKNQEDLVEEIDKVLAAAVKDGTVEALTDKHYEIAGA